MWHPPNTSLGDDQCQRQFTHLLNKEEIKYYSRISGARFLGAMLLEILTIALAIGISETYWHPFIYLLAVLIIGSRQQAFAVLMHEAAHYRAFSNRKWNNIFGEIAAFATPITMEGYRNNHFVHHRELNSAEDPDWQRTRTPDFQFPKTKGQIFWLLFLYLSGVNTIRDMKNVSKEKYVNDISRELKILRFGTLAIIVAASIYWGFWKQFLLYWVVPMFTSFMFFLYIRSVSEHYTNLEYENVLNHSRTVVASPLELWLFAPYGINYHIEHHLYPSVPFFRLAELHRHLMTKPVYAETAHITHGYVHGLFQESLKA